MEVGVTVGYDSFGKDNHGFTDNAIWIKKMKKLMQVATEKVNVVLSGELQETLAFALQQQMQQAVHQEDLFFPGYLLQSQLKILQESAAKVNAASTAEDNAGDSGTANEANTDEDKDAEACTLCDK